MLIAIRRSVESYCGRSGLVNQAAMQRYPCSPALNADGNEALAGELLEHCKDSLARYKYPRWFNFVDELPKTATGKIQRFRLRA